MGLAAHRDGRAHADEAEVAYAASHELRGPIVAICQLVESIQEDFAAELPDEVVRRLLQVRSKADRLDGILRGLTRYWRAADATEAPARIHLDRLVEEIARDLDVPPGAVIESDAGAIDAGPRAFRELVAILLENALRHSGRPDVRVRVALDPRPGGWELSVSDDGGGVPAAYRERVWGLFETLRAGGGPGLGLPIARRIAEAHGGRTWIEEAPGGGARVAVFWPTPRP